MVNQRRCRVCAENFNVTDLNVHLCSECDEAGKPCVFLLSMTGTLHHYLHNRISEDTFKLAFMYFSCHPAHLFGDEVQLGWPSPTRSRELQRAGTINDYDWDEFPIRNWEFDGYVPYEATWTHQEQDSKGRADCTNQLFRISIDEVEEYYQLKVIAFLQLVVNAHNEGRVKWCSMIDQTLLDSMPPDSRYLHGSEWHQTN